MKMRDVRAMSEEKITKKILDLRSELTKDRAQVRVGTRPENPKKIKTERRDVARLMTRLTEIKIDKLKRGKNKE